MARIPGLTMGSVTIGTAGPFDIYGTVAGADDYLAGAAHVSTLWAATLPDAKARALVTATRMIDRQAWAVDGIDLVVLAGDVESACYELAAAVVADPAGAQAGTASNIQSAGAGGASVSFFAPVAGTLFPSLVMQLLGQYLGGGIAGSDGGFWISGTDEESQFDTDDTYRRW